MGSNFYFHPVGWKERICCH